MARHAAAGDIVTAVILGEGITSRSRQRSRSRASRAALESLQADVRKAAKILGVKDVLTYALPDNRFDSVALLEIVKLIEREKARARPTIVYTHHPNDLNVDHRRVADAVQTAFRPQPGDLLPIILAFEVPSSTEYQSSLSADAFRPNVYVDIAETVDVKCRAMAAYRSEARPYPHPRSPRAIAVIAERNGLEVGLQAAERFALVRAVVQQSRRAQGR